MRSCSRHTGRQRRSLAKCYRYVLEQKQMLANHAPLVYTSPVNSSYFSIREVGMVRT